MDAEKKPDKCAGDNLKQKVCTERCPQCGQRCISKRHDGWQHECEKGHKWWMKYCYSL